VKQLFSYQKERIMSEKAEKEELLADFRPGYTIWKRCFGNLDVLIIQGEGGGLIHGDVTEGFQILREAIKKSKYFATFYDLTDGMKNLMPHAPALVNFAAEIRRSAIHKQTCIVVVCPEEQVRNWVRWILGLTSSGIPTHIVKSTTDGWQALLKPPSTDLVTDSFGTEASLPLTLQEDPSLLLQSLSF